MKHWRLPSRLGTWIIIGAVLAALMIAPTIAFGQTDGTKGSPVASDNTAVASQVVTTQAADAAGAYWTPERMQSAIPAEMVVDKTAVKASAESASAADGPAMAAVGNAPGQAPASEAQALDLGASATAPAAANLFTYPYPFDYSTLAPTSLYSVYPWITNGKVFFSQRTRTGSLVNFVCSGTSTTSGAGGRNRLVWTAGHCVNSGVNAYTQYNVPNGQWAVNVRFCPAYRSGQHPVYGCWGYLQLWSLNGWIGSGNFRYDQGVIITANTSSTGRGRLGLTVGTQGLAWNQPRTQHYPYDFWFAFGYPQAAPFDGNTMWWCSSSIGKYDAPNALAGPLTNGIGCNMTGGSSGGGWIWQFRMSGAGYVNSVNSYKYTNPAQPNAMYGPYFDVGTQNLYNSTRLLFP
jgi:hypothetical protein